MRLFTLALFTLIFFYQESSAQIRTYSNEFLAIGVGSRALGMGNAQVAITNDVTAAYWNPAGLNEVDKTQIGFQHAQWFAGAGNYNYGGIVIPLEQGLRNVGISFIRFAVDDIPNTLNLIQPDGTIDYDQIEYFSAADNAIILSYAQTFRKLEGLNVGGNVKIIRRKVGPFANSWGFGIDLGAQYNFDFGLKLGANLRDATTTPNSWTFNWSEQEQLILAQTGNIIPEKSVELTGQRLILGAAYELRFGKESIETGQKKFGLLTALDMDFTFDGRRNTLISSALSIDPHFGLELDYDQFIFLRAGFNNIQRKLKEGSETDKQLSIQPNVGIGLKIKNFNVDYAFTGLNNLNQGFYSNVISFSFTLDRGSKKYN